jgi:hypothetical protein
MLRSDRSIARCATRVTHRTGQSALAHNDKLPMMRTRARTEEARQRF